LAKRLTSFAGRFKDAGDVDLQGLRECRGIDGMLKEFVPEGSVEI